MGHQMGAACSKSKSEPNSDDSAALSTPSGAQIKAQLDALSEEWSLVLRSEDRVRGGFAAFGEVFQFTALIFDQCEDEDCECFGWDWSDSFHATSTCRGSRTEVARWLAQSKIGPQQGWAVCFTDGAGYPLL
jgi:hypothetical protein